MLPFLDKPFVLFGYSKGALFAYELALKWQQQGIKAQHLIIAASRPPAEIAADVSFKAAAISSEGTLKKIQDYQGTPQQVLNSKELLQIFIPILQADFSLLSTYQPSENGCVDCPISVLYGQKEADNSAIQANKWQDHTTQDCTLYSLPGGHFFIDDSPEELQEVLINLCHNFL